MRTLLVVAMLFAAPALAGDGHGHGKMEFPPGSLPPGESPCTMECNMKMLDCASVCAGEPGVEDEKNTKKTAGCMAKCHKESQPCVNACKKNEPKKKKKGS